MKKTILILALLLPLVAKKEKYTPQTGVDKANPAYMGKGGETQEVSVKGIAQITSAGEQDAYNRALEQALREAVEKVLGSMVKSETLVEDSKLIEDKIYSKSSGFVQKYTVLGDSKDGSTKIVEIKAWVCLGDVKNDAMALGLLQERVGRPYVLVLVDEKDLSGNLTTHAKNALHQKLSEKEFQFVDEGQLMKVLAARNMQVSGLTGVDTAKLAALAIDAGAQILLKGSVNSAKQNIQSTAIPANWVSVRTTVNVDAIYAGDATVLATSSAQMAAALLDGDSAHAQATKKAADKVSDDLIVKILAKWDNMVNNGFEYDLVIANVDFAESGSIQAALKKNVEGVKNVIQKSFNNNTLTLLVKYSGVVGDLASMIAAPGKLPLPLKVQNVGSKAIMMSK